MNTKKQLNNSINENAKQLSDWINKTNISISDLNDRIEEFWDLKSKIQGEILESGVFDKEFGEIERMYLNKD